MDENDAESHVRLSHPLRVVTRSAFIFQQQKPQRCTIQKLRICERSKRTEKTLSPWFRDPKLRQICEVGRGYWGKARFFALKKGSHKCNCICYAFNVLRRYNELTPRWAVELQNISLNLNPHSLSNRKTWFQLKGQKITTGSTEGTAKQNDEIHWRSSAILCKHRSPFSSRKVINGTDPFAISEPLARAPGWWNDAASGGLVRGSRRCSGSLQPCS